MESNLAQKNDFLEKKDIKLISLLYLILKYDVPCPQQLDTKGKSITFIMREALVNDVGGMKTFDESYISSFIDDAYNLDIWGAEGLESDAADIIKRKIKTESKEGVRIFAKYLCDCLYFDREIPNKSDAYLQPSEKFLEDIEKTSDYNLKDTTEHFSLLCEIAGAIDDLVDEMPEENQKDERAKCCAYIFKALDVRTNLFGKKDSDKYFESEAYAINLNNIGYSLLRLEGKYFALGENEEIIRKLYQEILLLMHSITRPLVKALIYSNLGAIEAKYGNYIEAVRYDLKAIDMKTSVVSGEASKNITAEVDSQLTLLRSYCNITANSVGALFQQEYAYKAKLRKNNVVVPTQKIEKYIRLIAIYSIKAIEYRDEIDKVQDRKKLIDYEQRAEMSRQFDIIAGSIETADLRGNCEAISENLKNSMMPYHKMKSDIEELLESITKMGDKDPQQLKKITEATQTVRKIIDQFFEYGKPSKQTVANEIKQSLIRAAKYLENIKKSSDYKERIKIGAMLVQINGIEQYLENNVMEYKKACFTVKPLDITVKASQYV